MSPAKQLVGKVGVHSQLGKVTVDNVHEGSRVFVDVTVIDRGKGWDKVMQRYTGVRTSGKDKDGNTYNNWSRGENKQFGHKDVVHIKTLA